MQEETVKSGFPHERVRKQEVCGSKKTCSYWWKKPPHQPITKLVGKSRDLVAGGQGEDLGVTGQKSDSSCNGDRGRDRDREF